MAATEEGKYWSSSVYVTLLIYLQGENPYIDRLPKITVADAKGSWPLFLEKMFGRPARNNNTLLNPIPQTVYYHYWDNWTRRGAKAKAKRRERKWKGKR